MSIIAFASFLSFTQLTADRCLFSLLSEYIHVAHKRPLSSSLDLSNMMSIYLSRRLWYATFLISNFLLLNSIYPFMNFLIVVIAESLIFLMILTYRCLFWYIRMKDCTFVIIGTMKFLIILYFHLVNNPLYSRVCITIAAYVFFISQCYYLTLKMK